MKKQFIVTILTILLAVAIVGCGKKEESSATTSEETVSVSSSVADSTVEEVTEEVTEDANEEVVEKGECKLSEEEITEVAKAICEGFVQDIKGEQLKADELEKALSDGLGVDFTYEDFKSNSDNPVFLSIGVSIHEYNDHSVEGMEKYFCDEVWDEVVRLYSGEYSSK